MDDNIKQYKLLDSYIQETYDDIKNITEIHDNLCNTIENKSMFNIFGIYIDDMHFQKNFMFKEINHIEHLKNISFRKLYSDTYRLYQKIVKRYIDITKEVDNISIIRKYYNDLGIRIFNDLDTFTIYKYRDIENINTHIQNHISVINSYLSDMSNNLILLKSKIDIGYNIGSFIIAYQGEINKLEVDMKIYNSIFSNILENNLLIINKLIKRSKEIAYEIKDKQDDYNNKRIKFINNDIYTSSIATVTPMTPNIIENDKIIECELQLQIDKNNNIE
jgi:hypothetical protein